MNGEVTLEKIKHLNLMKCQKSNLLLKIHEKSELKFLIY